MKKLTIVCFAILTTISATAQTILQSQMPQTNRVFRGDFVPISSGPGHSRNVDMPTFLNGLTNLPEFPGVSFSGIADGKLVGVMTGLPTGVTVGSGLGLNGGVLTATGFKFASIITYGADPTGVNPSDQAIILAQTNPAVYVPAGIYLITNASGIVISNSSRWFGDGPASVFLWSTNGIQNGYMIQTTSNAPVTFDSITFDGNQGNQIFGPSVASCNTPGCVVSHGSAGVRSGLLMNAANTGGGGGYGAFRCRFQNWSAYGCLVWGNADIGLRLQSFFLSQNVFTNNYTALVMNGFSEAEYGVVEENYFSHNWTQIEIKSPNSVFLGNLMHDSKYGFYIHPEVGSGGRSHNLIAGNMCNHCLVFVDLESCMTGINITDNNFLGSGLVILGMEGSGGNLNDDCVFANNYCTTTCWVDFSTGTNWFYNNTLTGDWTTNWVRRAGGSDPLQQATYGVYGFTNVVEWGNKMQGRGPVWFNASNNAAPPFTLTAQGQYSFPSASGSGGTNAAPQTLVDTAGTVPISIALPTGSIWPLNFRLTLTENITLSNPTGTGAGVDGEQFIVEFLENGTGGWTVTLASNYIGTDSVPLPSQVLTINTAANKRSWGKFIYNNVSGKSYCVGLVTE